MRRARGRVAVTYPDALTTWRLTARAITEDTRAGTTVARTTTTKDLIVRVDHAALPHRRRRSGGADDGPQLPDRAADRVACRSQADGPRAPIGAPRRATGGAARERRGTARRLALRGQAVRARRRSPRRRRPRATSMPSSCRSRSCRSAFAARPASSGSIVGAGEATADVDDARGVESRRRDRSRVALAPSLAGSVLGALDFLTDVSVRLHRANALELPAEPARHARAHRVEAGADRTAVGARSPGVRRHLQRLYDYQHDDGGWGWWKADGNHPFMTAYALWGLDEARRAGVKVDSYRIGNGARAAGAALRALPARRARPEGVRGLRAAARLPDERRDRVVRATAQQGRYRHAAARDELWDMRGRMSAYGRALLLLLLDEAKDPRGNELAPGADRRSADARRRVVVGGRRTIR